jgi:hypothetical protein
MELKRMARLSPLQILLVVVTSVPAPVLLRPVVAHLLLLGLAVLIVAHTVVVVATKMMTT